MQGLADDYVPQCERDEIERLRAVSPAEAEIYEREKAAKFRLRGLSAAQLANVVDLEAIEEDRATGVVRQGHLGSAVLCSLIAGLVGWRKGSLVDAKGNAVEFKGRMDQQGNLLGPTDEELDAIPGFLRREFYQEIKKRSSAVELFPLSA
jgi:ferric-dicitrate binding protein FerR (iron transport regulator)